MGTEDTIGFIGEENFLKICREFGLMADEIEVVRRVMETWDDLMAVEDTKERLRKKMEIGVEAIKGFPPEKRKRILAAQLAVNAFFIKFKQMHQ